MSGHEEDALFAHEMFMSRLDFEEAVRQALISTHLDARRACAASSAQARAAVEASVLLRRRCRDVRARAVALRKALASKRAMMAAGPRVAVPLSSLVVRLRTGEWLCGRATLYSPACTSASTTSNS